MAHESIICTHDGPFRQSYWLCVHRWEVERSGHSQSDCVDRIFVYRNIIFMEVYSSKQSLGELFTTWLRKGNFDLKKNLLASVQNMTKASHWALYLLFLFCLISETGAAWGIFIIKIYSTREKELVKPIGSCSGVANRKVVSSVLLEGHMNWDCSPLLEKGITARLPRPVYIYIWDNMANVDNSDCLREDNFSL